MPICDLPEETLDKIVAALDSPTHLRNLAAVSSQFHSIVEPYHTQFRIIRAPLLSPIWKKFTETALLAQNVRILEVQSAEPHGHYDGVAVDRPVVPAIFPGVFAASNDEINSEDEDDVSVLRAHYAAKNATYLDAERILVAALSRMSNLTSFQWSRTPPLIDPTREYDIWSTLARRCPSLNTIHVVDREKPYEPVLEETDDPAYQRPTRNPYFYLFQNLTSFSLKTEAFNVGNKAFPNFDQGSEMLIKKCPNLEVLNVEFVLYSNPHTKTVAGTPLLSASFWPALCEITLFGFNFVATELASFLTSHSTIEVLTLTGIRIDEPLNFLEGVLPRLRLLVTEVGSGVTHSILDSKTQEPRPLEYITGATLSDDFLDSLEQSGSGRTLMKLSIVCMGDLSNLLLRLSRIVPRLEWLIINLDTTLPTDPSLIPTLGQLTCLRILQGIRLVNSTCEPPSKNTETIRAIATACPNLRRLDWYMGSLLDRTVAVIIERKGTHVTWDLRKIVKEGKEGTTYSGWGERGYGSFELL